MQNHDDDVAFPDLELDEEQRELSDESQEESERAKQKEDLEGKKAKGKHRRSEQVKDNLARAIVVIIWFLVPCTMVVMGSLISHYAIRPHLSEVNAEVLKGVLASFTVLNAVLIITKTVELD